MQAMSLGRSNCTGLSTLAASAKVCRGLADSTGMGMGGGVYFEALPPLDELPLFVEEASSSFYMISIKYLFK